MRSGILLFLWLLLFITSSYAMAPAEEKLLFKTLGEIKGELKRINTRIDNVEKRIEETNKKMDEKFAAMQMYVDKRFEDINERLNGLKTLIND